MPVFNACRPAGIDTAFRLPPKHEFVRIEGGVRVRYQFLDADPSGVYIRHLDTGLDQQFSHEEFAADVNAEVIDPLISGRDKGFVSLHDRLPDDQIKFCDHMLKLAQAVERRIEMKEASLSDESLRRVLREETIKLSLGWDEAGEIKEGMKKRGRKQANASHAEVRGIRSRKKVVTFEVPSPRTYRRMRRALIESGWDLAALRDKRADRSCRYVPRISEPRTASLMADWVNLYKDRSRPSMAMLYKLAIGTAKASEINQTLRARGKLPIPVGGIKSLAEVNLERTAAALPPLPAFSLSTFERAIGALDEFEVIAGREGHDVAHRRLKISGRRTIAVRAGERVAMDCWKSQIRTLKLPQTVWEGLDDDLVNTIARLRLLLCVAIDEASRCVLGAYLAVSATAKTAVRTLEMVGRDKQDIADWAGCRGTWQHRCTPETVATDNGSEFINEEFRACVNDVGSRNELGPTGHPDARPIVESFFRNLDRRLMQFFQGRTFAGVGEKGSYDPDAVANVTAEVLGKALVRYIVDVYHNTPHMGLGGETPNDAWERLNKTYQVIAPWSRATNRVVFGFSDRRRIQNQGIRFLGNFYRVNKGNRLAELRKAIGQKDVAIRVDLSNLGRIAVRKIGPGNEWFSVECDLASMEGVSAQEWVQACMLLKRKYAEQAGLREEVAIQALNDIRRMGKDSAEARGIGPSTMSDDELRRYERDLFRQLNIVSATNRGACWSDLDEAEEGVEAPELPDGSPSAADGFVETTSRADEPQPIADSQGAQNNQIRRRRRGLSLWQE